MANAASLAGLESLESKSTAELFARCDLRDVRRSERRHDVHLAAARRRIGSPDHEQICLGRS